MDKVRDRTRKMSKQARQASKGLKKDGKGSDDGQGKAGQMRRSVGQMQSLTTSGTTTTTTTTKPSKDKAYGKGR